MILFLFCCLEMLGGGRQVNQIISIQICIYGNLRLDLLSENYRMEANYKLNDRLRPLRVQIYWIVPDVYAY